jgi:hypothetical protein
MLRTTVVAVLLGFAAIGQAHATLATPALDTSKPTAAQIQAIYIDLAGNKTYSELSPTDRASVINALARVQEKLGDEAVLSSLHPTAQVDVVNDQELVNGLLSKAAADSRLICRREMLTGSNRPQTVCMTAAERTAMRERSMDVMRKTGISQPENRP